MTPQFRRLIEHIVAEAPDGAGAGACLILAPHPDDEVLGCGGTIARRVGQGVPVFIGFLTDGRRGAPPDADDARAIREEEATRAAAALGLPSKALTFFGVEDGQLPAYVDPMITRVAALIGRLGIEELFVPYRRDYHRDHWAAWQIGQSCRPMVRRLYEFPIWFGPWIWGHLGWRAKLAAAAQLADLRHAVKMDIRDVLPVKQRALNAYSSQVRAFQQIGPWGQEFLDGFLSPFELFFARTRDGRR